MKRVKRDIIWDGKIYATHEISKKYPAVSQNLLRCRLKKFAKPVTIDGQKYYQMESRFLALPNSGAALSKDKRSRLAFDLTTYVPNVDGDRAHMTVVAYSQKWLRKPIRSNAA